jgi:D-alanine-D-alanine ligase
MNINTLRIDFPVLLLYNLDPTWPAQDRYESVEIMEKLRGELQKQGHPVLPLCLEDADLTGLLSAYDPEKYLVFNWCEEIPGLPRSAAEAARGLEKLGFTFTGADSQGLTLAQDKRLVKRALHQSGLPTPAWKIYETNTRNGWECFPAIVKPAFEHCSFGITREAVVRSPQELHQRIEFVLREFSQPALVEEFIDGREFHVTVIGNGTLHVLPPAEMDFSAFADVRDRLCTYESKFDPQSTYYKEIRLHLPAPLTPEEQARLEQTALAAYRATSCRDYARLDIRMRDGTFYVLDVNPNADFSPDTSVALAAEVAGYSYGQLGSWLVNLAAQRHPVFGTWQPEPEISSGTHALPLPRGVSVLPVHLGVSVKGPAPG